MNHKLYTLSSNLLLSKFCKTSNVKLIMRSISDILFSLRSKLLRRYYNQGHGLDMLKKSIKPTMSIISNNCFGGAISNTLKYSYNSPTVGLYFMYPDYITFLEHLEGFISSELEFKPQSIYENVNKERVNNPYPIGRLVFDGFEIEIEFLHYHSEMEAKEKWERRCKRIQMNNMIIIGSEVDGCTDQHVDSFMKLHYSNMLFLGRKKRFYKESGYHYVKLLNSKRFKNLYAQAHFVFKYLC